MSSLEGAPSASESEMCTNEGIFKPKKKPKIIRVLTVFAYVLSVSMAAILLSVYYIFVWKADASPSNRYNEVQQVENPCGPRAYKFMDHPGLTFEESGPTLKNLSSVATESSANDTVNSRGKREIKTEMQKQSYDNEVENLVFADDIYTPVTTEIDSTLWPEAPEGKDNNNEDEDYRKDTLQKLLVLNYEEND